MTTVNTDKKRIKNKIREEIHLLDGRVRDEISRNEASKRIRKSIKDERERVDSDEKKGSRQKREVKYQTKSQRFLIRLS